MVYYSTKHAHTVCHAGSSPGLAVQTMLLPSAMHQLSEAECSNYLPNCVLLLLPQVQDMVVVSRCTQRTFGAAEWATLRTQLAAWRDSLHGAQTLLGSMQMAAKTGPAGALGSKPAITAAI